MVLRRKRRGEGEPSGEERPRSARRAVARATLLVWAFLGAAGAAACSSADRRGGDEAAGDASNADDPDDAPDAGDDGARPPTYTGVYDQVLLRNCASPFCHAGTGDYFELASMAIGYASLVDASAQGPDCAKTGLKRVDPGHPETSLLYLKITVPPCGAKMPRFYGDGGMLQPDEIEQVKEWILLGALDN